MPCGLVGTSNSISQTGLWKKAKCSGPFLQWEAGSHDGHSDWWMLELTVAWPCIQCLFQSAFLPGKSHGQRSPVGYSSWGCKELDTTEQLNLLSCFMRSGNEVIQVRGVKTGLPWACYEREKDSRRGRKLEQKGRLLSRGKFIQPRLLTPGQIVSPSVLLKRALRYLGCS